MVNFLINDAIVPLNVEKGDLTRAVHSRCERILDTHFERTGPTEPTGSDTRGTFSGSRTKCNGQHWERDSPAPAACTGQRAPRGVHRAPYAPTDWHPAWHRDYSPLAGV